MKPVVLSSSAEIRAASCAIAFYLAGGSEGRSEDDPTFNWVTESRQRQNTIAMQKGRTKLAYSACGDLAASVLYLLGSRDPALVNRNAPPLTWEVGKNLEKLYNAPMFVHAAGADDSAGVGDILYLQSPDHVFVLTDIDTGAHTLEAAQYGRWSAARGAFGSVDSETYTMTGETMHVGARTLIGWLDIARVPLDAPSWVPGDFPFGIPYTGPELSDPGVP